MWDRMRKGTVWEKPMCRGRASSWPLYSGTPTPLPAPRPPDQGRGEKPQRMGPYRAAFVRWLMAVEESEEGKVLRILSWRIS